MTAANVRAKRIRKVSATVLPVFTIVTKPAPTKKAPLKAPTGGFRTPTVKDRAVIEAITASPKLTAREYGDRLGFNAIMINDCILYTREGRTLAEKGYVSLPAASRPRWANYIENQDVLVTRRRESQFPLLQFGKNSPIKGSNRTSIQEISEIVRKLDTTTSPRVLKMLHANFCKALLTTGTARAKEQALLEAYEAYMKKAA